MPGTVFLGLLEVTLRVLELGFGEAPLVYDRTIHHKHPSSYVYRRKDEGWGEFGGFLIEYDEIGRTYSATRRPDPRASPSAACRP